MKLTAENIAGDSELFDLPVSFGRSKLRWECMGYSKTGRSVIFSRLVTLAGKKLFQVNRYVKPETPVRLPTLHVPDKSHSHPGASGSE